jgi:ABC-type phosphate transport system ATPase subunit
MPNVRMTSERSVLNVLLSRDKLYSVRDPHATAKIEVLTDQLKTHYTIISVTHSM